MWYVPWGVHTWHDQLICRIFVCLILNVAWRFTAYTFVTWLIHMWYVPWLVHTCDITYSNVAYSGVSYSMWHEGLPQRYRSSWYDSWSCCICDMNRSYVTWLIHQTLLYVTRLMIVLHMRHDSFTCDMKGFPRVLKQALFKLKEKKERKKVLVHFEVPWLSHGMLSNTQSP